VYSKKFDVRFYLFFMKFPLKKKKNKYPALVYKGMFEFTEKK